jgi:hypothetical protein
MSFPSSPSHIKPAHWLEWTVKSCIDPKITAANLVSLDGVAPYDRLFYSDGIKRLNTGRLPSWILKKYSHLEAGGWWSSGVDPLTGEDNLWGCFKPDFPRIDSTKGKYLKYEHPLKTTASAFFLRVPWAIGLKIATRYGLAEEYSQRKVDSTDSHIDNYFWRWVLDHPQVNITITEGVKKAAALLTQGIVAIGLPGIWGGYRRNEGKPSLIPELDYFTTGDRHFYFAFDQDEKPKTRLANRKALQHTTKLLKAKRCKVSIITWEPLIKGVDDLIFAKGVDHFLDCYKKASTYEDWQVEGLRELSYRPALRLDSSTKYIGNFSPLPEAKLIGIKAPKGSGKTEQLVKICETAQHNGQKVLVLTHRTQLGQALCSRFGIDYVTEINNSTTKGVFGFGLCWDSLRKNSQARFNPDDWHDCIVILDECEQSIWHLLNARTEVSKHRVEVLRNFQKLIQNTLESDNGKVYLSDADLSDVSIDFIKSLVDFPIEPWVVIKEGNPTPWDVTSWQSVTELWGALIDHVNMGGKPFIFVDGQKAKSKWGTQSLEKDLSKRFPDKKILRIDAESVADPTHPAYGCIDQLNIILKNWDIVIASPTIETGVSIDIRGHFTSVWDIAQGVIPVDSVLQRMARVREPVPRHFWAKGYGIGRIGNGSTSPTGLMDDQNKKFKAHLAMLVESEFLLDLDPASNFQPQSLRTWARMAARINLGMIRYNHEIERALLREGHIVRIGNYQELTKPIQPDIIKKELTDSRDEIYEAQRESIAAAPNPDSKVYDGLSKKQARTQEELHQLRKGELSRKYSEELVTPDLVERDDKGEFQKARLHYYMTIGRGHLGDREKSVVEKALESGEGEFFLPDFNRNMIGGKIKFLEALDIPKLLQQDTEWTNKTPLLINLAVKVRKYSQQIRSVLGIAVKEKDTPITIARKFLNQCLGLSFSAPIKKGTRGNQIRHYQPVAIPEWRQQILEVWLQRDEASRLATAAESADPVSINGDFVSVVDTVSTTGNISINPALPTGSDGYQSDAYHSPAYSLVELLATVSTAEELCAVIDRSPVEEVEDAISMQDSQPQRNLLQGLLRQTQQLKEIGNQLLGGFSQGVEALKEVLKPLNFNERWDVFQLLEKLSPEAMESLVKIAPNWYEFCLVR